MNKALTLVYIFVTMSITAISSAAHALPEILVSKRLSTCEITAIEMLDKKEGLSQAAADTQYGIVGVRTLATSETHAQVEVYVLPLRKNGIVTRCYSQWLSADRIEDQYVLIRYCEGVREVLVPVNTCR